MTQGNAKPTGRDAAEVMLMLPWYVAGTLSRSDCERVEAVLPHFPELNDKLDSIREELGEAVALNEALGAPSPALGEKLMAAIGARAPPVRQRAADAVGGWLTNFFASLSPRSLAAAAACAVLAIGVQSAIIGDLVMKPQTPEYRGLEQAAGQTGTFVMVRFAHQATAADITDLLQVYHAAMVDGPTADGLYRVRLAPTLLSGEELARLMHRFRQESLIETAQWVAAGH